jgi:hypothetical protein
LKGLEAVGTDILCEIALFNHGDGTVWRGVHYWKLLEGILAVAIIPPTTEPTYDDTT